MKTAVFLISFLALAFARAQADEVINESHIQCGDLTYETMAPGIELDRFQSPAMSHPAWAFTYYAKLKTSAGTVIQRGTSCLVQSVSIENSATVFHGSDCSVRVQDHTVGFEAESAIEGCTSDLSLADIKSQIERDQSESHSRNF